MIAHRLGTLKTCDMILVMEQGRLLEVKESALDGEADSAVPQAVSAYAG